MPDSKSDEMTSAPVRLPAGAALPALPPSVPRAAYPRWIRALGRWTLRALGWRLVGGFADAPRQVLIGAPHTTNWDGLIGLAAAAECGVGFQIFAKRALFIGPLGWILRVFGGLPIDRDTPGGSVATAVEHLQSHPAGIIALTPEGTRSAVERWKTGFHRIAVEADVPIAVAALDWGRKQIGIVGTVVPSGDLDADLAAIGDVLAGVVGKHPDRGTLPPPPKPGLAHSVAR